METTSTTSEILTADEAAEIMATRELMQRAANRIGLFSYDDDRPAQVIRSHARIAETLEAARDALMHALITAEVYGNCRNAEQARRVV